MRARFALFASAAALLAAGCGGDETTAPGSASAALAPKGAGLFVSVASDRDAVQWQRLEALLDRAPALRDGLDDMLSGGKGDSGVTWDDVEPAVGEELLVVVPAGGDSPVLLTKPEDEQALASLVEKMGATTVTGEVDGWTVVAETQKALDGYQAALAQGSLAEDDAYVEATSGLPAEALARVFVRTEGLRGAAGRAAGAADSLAPLSGLSGLAGGAAEVAGTTAMTVSAEEQGLRVKGFAQVAGGPGVEEFAPTLLGRVPADAVLAVTFEGGDLVGEQLRAQAGGDEQALKPFEQLLGVSFEDVARAFAGEAVVYVRPAEPVPELTLATDSGDGTIGRLVGGLVGSLSALGGGDRPKPSTSTVDGVTVTTVPLGDDLAISYAQVGGTFVLTTAKNGIDAFRSGRKRLVDDPAFQRLAGDAGLGSTTAGFAYVDVDGLVPLLEALAKTGDDPLPDDAAAALEAIDGGAVNATADGSTTRFEGFLRVG